MARRLDPATRRVPRFMIRPQSAPAATLVLLLAVAGCTSAGAIQTPAPTSPGGSTRSVASSPRATAAPAATASRRSSPSPSATPPAAAPSATSGVGPSLPGTPSTVPSTSTIDWGVIWDALPPSFPQYPGTQPTVTGGGPASAILDVPAEAGVASGWFQAALRAAGFAIVGASGPREDGSYDITASKGSPDCQTEISLAPLGATTTATIYVAAACPFS